MFFGLALAKIHIYSNKRHFWGPEIEKCRIKTIFPAVPCFIVVNTKAGAWPSLRLLVFLSFFDGKMSVHAEAVGTVGEECLYLTCGGYAGVHIGFGCLRTALLWREENSVAETVLKFVGVFGLDIGEVT